MFLHQIFYQGLKARIASWPTLVLGKQESLTTFFVAVNAFFYVIYKNIIEKNVFSF